VPATRVRLARGLALAALALPVAAAGGSSAVYHASGLLRGSLLADRPVPIYAADPGHPWNQAVHLLFTSRVVACVSRFYVDGPAPVAAPDLAAASDGERRAAIREYYRRRFAGSCTRVTRLEGGDVPELLLDRDVRFLLEPERFGRLTAALTAVAGAAETPGPSLEARVLFQHDLWSRFDALHALDGSLGGAARRDRRARLLDLLGRTIARLALRPDELAALRSNWPEIVRAHPEAVPDLFAGAGGWRELLTSGAREDETTSHATTAGHRQVFRVFLRSPESAGGTACLERAFLREPGDESTCVRWGRLLAPRSRVLLVESLLALASSGEAVATPLVTAVQVRDVRPVDPGADGQLGLGDLPVRVLHATREALAAQPRPGGGLQPLEPDAPVPAGFVAFGRPPGAVLQPAATVCMMCHDVDGSALMTPNRHDVRRIDVLRPDNPLAAERVLRAKRARADYQALRRFFGPGGR
jgi:hypothetical protein